MVQRSASQGGRARAVRAAALAAVGATGLASCSSGGPSPGASTSSTAMPARSTTTSPPPASTTTTVAVPGPSGALSAATPIALPALSRVVATEGPDGAVFVAPEAPGAPGPSVVYVVDGSSPVQVAEHVGAGVAALAADASNLYVADYAHVTAFSRSSGTEVAQWSLPPLSAADASNDDLVAMTATAGRVFVRVTQGDAVSVYSIEPSSSAGPRELVSGLGAAVGPDGAVYYERSDDHLVKLSTSGVSTVGPALADAPNGLGGGVQYVSTVAGGLVWVSEPAGQGLDARYTEYDTSTLQAVGTYDGTTAQQFADAGTAGALVLSGPNGPGSCPQPAAPAYASCVYRITAAQTLVDQVVVGEALLLVGPDPAVVAQNPTTSATELLRIS